MESASAIVANSAVAIAAAMEGGRGAEATSVETTTAEATDMSSATVEAASTGETAAAGTAPPPGDTPPAMKAPAMSTTAAAVANLDHVVTCGLRRRQRRRIDWSHRLGRTCGSGRQHQCRGGRNPEQAHRACPETQYSQHGLLPESGQRIAAQCLAPPLFICGRS